MTQGTIALIIFALCYIGIIFARLPRLNVDRPSAAFIGAVAMICFGVVSFSDAVGFIDSDTIFLLLGMMIVVAGLKTEGFFSLVSAKVLRFAKTRFRLLVCIVVFSGLGSAFLVNDAVVLIFTPVIISLCRSVKINPMPYLIAEILASNTGSVIAMTGNPQNMLVGISSGISYFDFLLRLLPVGVVGMAFSVLVVRIVYRKEFSDKSPLRAHKIENPKGSGVVISSVIFILLVVGFFFGKLLGLPICVIALAAAGLVILLSKHRPAELMQQVDWVLLLFFASLFIVVGSVRQSGLLDFLLDIPLEENLAGILSLHGASLVMSQILSNVPYSVLMLPLMQSVNSETLWLALASAATLAGNATVIGAMANLIVIEQAEKEGVRISFWEFFKSGFAVTVLSLLFSVLVLWLQIP